MPYGNLNLKMREALVPFIKGRTVYDLGAGDCDHGRTLRDLGAARVVCLDKEAIPVVPSNVEFRQGYFAHLEVPSDLDVVFLGWPINYPCEGLREWIGAAKAIIYLGHNFDGTACGTPELFAALQARQLLCYIEDPRNALIVVGDFLAEPRPPTSEEVAALSSTVLSHPMRVKAG